MFTWRSNTVLAAMILQASTNLLQPSFRSVPLNDATA